MCTLAKFHVKILSDQKKIQQGGINNRRVNHPEYQKLKVVEHLRTCGGGNFQIFPFLQVRSEDTDFRKTLERNFIQKFKVKLNQLK